MRTILQILICLLGTDCRGVDHAKTDVIVENFNGELGWLGWYGPTDAHMRSAGCAQRGTDNSGVISSDGAKFCDVWFASDYENAMCVLSDDQLRAPATSKGFRVSGKFIGTLAYSCVGAYGSNDAALTKQTRRRGTPVVAACGDGPWLVGDDLIFRVTIGLRTSTCTITFADAWVDLPAYAVSPENGTPVTYTVTRTGMTLTGAAGSTYDVANVSCESRNTIPAVICGDSATMNYDGCRWGCKRTITGNISSTELLSIGGLVDPPGIITGGKIATLIYSASKRRWLIRDIGPLAVQDGATMTTSTATGRVNNLRIGDGATIIWWDGDANLDLGGLVATSDGNMSGQDGRVVYIANGTKDRTIMLLDDDHGSTEIMRFSFGVQ